VTEDRLRTPICPADGPNFGGSLDVVIHISASGFIKTVVPVLN
jgi:hypothetical protein